MAIVIEVDISVLVDRARELIAEDGAYDNDKIPDEFLINLIKEDLLDYYMNGMDSIEWIELIASTDGAEQYAAEEQDDG